MNKENRRTNKDIKSEVHIILNTLLSLLNYILLFIPYTFAFLWNTLKGDKDKRKYYFNKLFKEPFRIFREILDWFFSAKVTASLIILLLITYSLQILFPDIMNGFKTHPEHLFSLEIYTLFTSIFLHTGIVHLISNLVALLIFGRAVEHHLNKNTLWIFLFSGIFANIVSHLVSLLINDINYSLGASGAIAGLIIFGILLEPLRLSFLTILPLPIFILGWILIALDIIGLTQDSDVNHLAHLGGYAALLVSLYFLEIHNRKKITEGFILNIVGLLVVFAVLQFLGFNLIEEFFNLF